MTGFSSIPFKGESGLSQIEGIAKFSSAGVVIEFESKFLGLFKGGVKEIRISLDEILDITFKKGLFKRGASIQIRLKSFSKLSALPSEDGKLKIKIKREDFEIAREAVDSLQKELDSYHAELPPVHTPISTIFDNTSELDTAKLDDSDGEDSE